jgi:DNA modification methylase
MFNTAKILVGDNRKTIATLEAGSVQTCITSPPYWGLRDYGEDDQIGLESSPDEYVEQLCLVFDEVWRVLADDGTLWLNLGDSYAGNNSRASNNGRAGFGTEREGVFTKTGEGLKTKDLVGIPWRVAFALQARGWYLRSEIIWHKPNPMPESVTDRPTKSHEHIFLLSKSAKYFYDHEAIKEPAIWANDSRNGSGRNTYDGKRAENDGFIQQSFVTVNDTRNKRDVWTVPVQPYAGAHFAVYPPALIEPCVLAGSREGDTILDPFSGSGTTGVVALRNGRNYVGTELNPEYAELSRHRISDDCGMFGEVEVIDVHNV